MPWKASPIAIKVMETFNNSANCMRIYIPLLLLCCNVCKVGIRNDYAVSHFNEKHKVDLQTIADALLSLSKAGITPVSDFQGYILKGLQIHFLDVEENGWLCKCGMAFISRRSCLRHVNRTGLSTCAIGERAGVQKLFLHADAGQFIEVYRIESGMNGNVNMPMPTLCKEKSN